MLYEDYDELRKQQREKNEEYLVLFREDLVQLGLTAKTIRDHINNVNFYINTYLLREEPLAIQEGCGPRIDDFLGSFFIRRCMWSTPSTIKTTAASIKKFYKSMNDHGYISKADYKGLCDIIKENMPIWQDDCEAYNSGSSAENPFLL